MRIKLALVLIALAVPGIAAASFILDTASPERTGRHGLADASAFGRCDVSCDRRLNLSRAARLRGRARALFTDPEHWTEELQILGSRASPKK
jgi:hypothetical protein